MKEKKLYVVPKLAEQYDLSTDGIISPDEVLYWCKMNSLILILSFTKLMNLCRVNEQFGQMVTLITQVVKDAVTFTGFLTVWICLFSLLFQINGIIIDKPNPEAVTYEWDDQDFVYPQMSVMKMNGI